MNGREIERVLDLIDATREATRRDAEDYIQKHIAALEQQMKSQGYVDIPTRAGTRRIFRSDLETVAA